MSIYPTGNTGFDAAVAAAEAARQTAIAVATTQTAAMAADISYLTAVIAAGQQFGIKTEAEATGLLILQGKVPYPR